MMIWDTRSSEKETGSRSLARRSSHRRAVHEQTEIDTTGAKGENGIRPAGPFQIEETDLSGQTAGPFQIEETDLSGQRATRGHFFRLAYQNKGAKLILLARLP
jgi:hypothetical protein